MLSSCPVFVKKSFIGAKHFLTLFEPSTQSVAKSDDFIHTIRRQERVTGDCERLLTDAVHAARTLDEPDDGPRQIEIHDD